MSVLIKDAKIFYQNELVDMDFYVDDAGKCIIASDVDIESDDLISAAGCIVIPSLINPFISGYNNDVLAANSVRGGFGICCISGDDTRTALENTEYGFLNSTVVITDDLSYISNGRCFAFRSEVVNEEITEVLQDNEGLLVYSGEDYGSLDSLEIAVYITGVTHDHLDEIKRLKENNENLSCGISITELLGNQEKYLGYIEGGVIDMVETDEDVSLTYSFGLLYSKLVKGRKMELDTLINLMSYNPADYFGLSGGEIVNFETANVAVFDVHVSERINDGKFAKNYSQAKCLALLVDGDIVYRND